MRFLMVVIDAGDLIAVDLVEIEKTNSAITLIELGNIIKEYREFEQAAIENEADDFMPFDKWCNEHPNRSLRCMIITDLPVINGWTGRLL